MRKQLVTGKKLLLFVDTGDNCRCPLAIGYLTKLLSQKNIDYIDLRHMGVMTPNDLLPTPEVVQLLKEEGVDIKYHRSRPVNDDLIRSADLVLGFTAIHVQTCLRRVPESKSKTFLLKEYVGLAHTGDQIHDPMGSTMEIFKKYFSDIKLSLQRLVETEFITTPPEPKEVVIAPTVTKPRQIQEEDEVTVAGGSDDSRKAKSRKKPAASDEKVSASARKSKAEKPEKAAKPKPKKSAGAKPVKETKKPAKAAAKKEAPVKKAAKKPVKAAAAGKPKAAGKTTKTTKTAKAEKPAKSAKTTAKTAKTAKPAKAAKPKAAKPAAKKASAPAGKAKAAKSTSAKKSSKSKK